MIINSVIASGGGSAPAHYIQRNVDANGKLVTTGSMPIIDFTGVTEIGDYALYYAYFNNTAITGSVNMSSVTKIINNGCVCMFYGCTGLSGKVDLSSLTNGAGCPSMFYGCTGITEVDLSSLIDGSTGGFGSMFYGCTSLTTVDLGSLTTMNASYTSRMFQGCTSLTNLDVSKLEILGGYNKAETWKNCFSGCTSLVNLNLESLTSIEGSECLRNAWNGCTSLTNVDMSSFTSIKENGAMSFGNAFQYCVGLTNFVFDSLTEILSRQGMYGAFYGCSNLASLSFPSLTNLGSYTNQFDSMLYGVSGCTVHFPSNMQSVIGSWTSVTSGFNGFNTTVLFDLPATVTLTGADTVTYTRNPKYDTATALAWKVGAYGTTNFTPAYYTSGTTDPAVSDTIYSDSACTVAVTTISSIS